MTDIAVVDYGMGNLRSVAKALAHVAPEQVILAPDCGMKYLPREVAQGKLQSMVAAAQMLRREHGA